MNRKRSDGILRKEIGAWSLILRLDRRTTKEQLKKKIQKNYRHTTKTMNKKEVDETTFELVNQIALESNWKSAASLIPQLLLNKKTASTKNTNKKKIEITKTSTRTEHDDQFLKRTLTIKLGECLRTGLRFPPDTKMSCVTLLQTIIDRFLSCKLLISSSNTDKKNNSNNKNKKKKKSDDEKVEEVKRVNDWLVQLFMDGEENKVGPWTIMSWLVECMKQYIFESDDEEENDDSDDEHMDPDERLTRLNNGKYWASGAEQLWDLYKKWKGEPYFSFVLEHEQLKIFLLRLFTSCVNWSEDQTREQWLKSCRIYQFSLQFENVKCLLSRELIFNDFYYNSIEKHYFGSRAPSYFYDGEAPALVLELIRDELLVNGHEKYKSADDVWKNSALTVALYIVLHTKKNTPVSMQLPSYLFPIHGTMDDSYSSLMYLILLYHAIHSNKTIQMEHKKDILLVLTQALEIDNAGMLMVCACILGKLSQSVFEDMFECLKPILQNVAITIAKSDELRVLSRALGIQVKSTLNHNVPFAKSIIHFIFDMAYEFRESSDLSHMTFVLSRVLRDENIKIESDRLSEYISSLTTTLENRAKAHFSHPDDETRDKLFEAFCAVFLAPDHASSIDDVVLSRVYSVIYQCLSAENEIIRGISWDMFIGSARNNVLDGMEEAHQKNSSSNHMSLFHYTFSLVCKGLVDTKKLKTGRKLLKLFYQDQTSEELELFDDQILPLYFQKLLEALIGSKCPHVEEQAFLSLGLLYCLAPDLIRNSASSFADAYLDYFEDGRHEHMSEAKPKNVACWSLYLDLKYDHVSSSDEDHVQFVLDELYETELYDEHHQILQPLASRLFVAVTSQNLTNKYPICTCCHDELNE